MKLFLNDSFKKLWSKKDPFEEVLKLNGTEFRNKEGRRTFQLMIENNSYFAKVHRGIGWLEIVKNLLHLRLPVVGASNEYFAALKLSNLGVDTLTPVAYGTKGLNPAKKLSFILTEDLSETISLEDYCADWLSDPPSFVHKKAIIKLLANVSRTMHGAGINHRDYYICHFLLDKNSISTAAKPRCYLIDLHRAQLRSNTPVRWAVKDIAGLYFSAMDIGLTKRDLLRFAKYYEGHQSIRDVNIRSKFWAQVITRANALYKKENPSNVGF